MEIVVVEVSGYQFVFPQQCACCGVPPQSALVVSATKTTGKRVVRTATNSWQIPYCMHCLAHVAKVRLARTWLSGLVVIGIITGVALSVFTGFWPAALVATLIAVIGVLVSSKYQSEASAMRLPTCCASQEAASFLGWDGTRNRFAFSSHSFATAFMKANFRKLVNISPQAAAILNAAGMQPSANAPQVAQRHRS